MLARFNKAKKQILNQEFRHLNPPQKEAVFHSKGAMLILAGAGSGKTTTVVNKIGYLMKYGDAYEDAERLPYGVDEDLLQRMEQCTQEPDEEIVSAIAHRPVAPYRILALTFTNKAANEMKERIERIAGEQARDMWIGTFHSICVRILRKNIDFLDHYNKNFVIYDSDDQRTLIKECLNALRINDKEIHYRLVADVIGKAKDKMLSPDEFILQTGDNMKMQSIGRVYKMYQRRLEENNALDFDDIIVNTVRLFQKNQEVLDYYAGKFEYILVDEYQDTNLVQYRLVAMLASGHGNLCVVGDDDQSIYGWRGADITNIIEFEHQFQDCKVIKLEQNYRSTKIILEAANSVIKNNTMRKSKKLWTDKESGDKINFYQADNDRDEARFVAHFLLDNGGDDSGRTFNDCCVLYRTHAQSRIIEDALIREGIPYRIIGGLRFYERKEIKDVMAYLRLLINSNDSVSLKRILNVPRRGIGDTTIARIEEISQRTGKSMFEVIQQSKGYEALARSSAKLEKFVLYIESLRQMTEEKPASGVISSVIATSGLLEEYMKEGEIEGKTRVENMDELVSVAMELEANEDAVTLEDFLAYTSLITDMDSSDEEGEKVTLMSMHSAKGLEFDVVAIIGMDEGLFPKVNEFAVDERELEEERRLCYVSITRARQKLCMTCARQRLLYGQSRYYAPSRFFREIPDHLMEGKMERKPTRLAFHFDTTPQGKIQVKQKPAQTNPAVSFGFTNKSTAKTKEKQPFAAFQAGDRVIHRKFGKGTVADVSAAPTMTILVIDFDGAGRKSIISTAVEKE